jgi:hypothetical protein
MAQVPAPPPARAKSRCASPNPHRNLRQRTVTDLGSCAPRPQARRPRPASADRVGVLHRPLGLGHVGPGEIDMTAIALEAREHEGTRDALGALATSDGDLIPPGQPLGLLALRPARRGRQAAKRGASSRRALTSRAIASAFCHEHGRPRTARGKPLRRRDWRGPSRCRAGPRPAAASWRSYCSRASAKRPA